MVRAGGPEGGRGQAARSVAGTRTNPGYDAEYWAYRSASDAIAIGNQLVDLGAPVEAIRVVQAVPSDPESVRSMNRYGGERLSDQLQQVARTAMKGMTPEAMARATAELLTPRPAPKPKAGEGEAQRQGPRGPRPQPVDRRRRRRPARDAQRVLDGDPEPQGDARGPRFGRGACQGIARGAPARRIGEGSRRC